MGLRQERMADEVRDIIAGFFLGGILNDPRLQSVTITAVKMSGDLQIATVYYRVFDDAQKADAGKGLASASPMFRKRLAEVLDVRRAPELTFKYDDSLENAARIETLLTKI